MVGVWPVAVAGVMVGGAALPAYRFGRTRIERPTVAGTARGPLIRLGGVAVLAGAAGAWFSWRIGARPALAAFLGFAALGAALAAIDLETKQLPTPLMRPLYGLVAIPLLVDVAANGVWWPLARAGIGAAGFTLFYAALWFGGGLGFGDVRLAGVVGMLTGWLGWMPLIVAAVAPSFLAVPTAVVLLVTRRIRFLGGTMAAGPYIFLAGCIAALLAPPGR